MNPLSIKNLPDCIGVQAKSHSFPKPFIIILKKKFNLFYYLNLH